MATKKAKPSWERRVRAVLRHHDVSSYRTHPEAEWIEFELRPVEREWASESTYISADELAKVQAIFGAGYRARVTGYNLGTRHCCEAPDDSDHVLYVLVERV
jgi:hypothetical protein